VATAALTPRVTVLLQLSKYVLCLSATSLAPSLMHPVRPSMVSDGTLGIGGLRAAGAACGELHRQFSCPLNTALVASFDVINVGRVKSTITLRVRGSGANRASLQTRV
jgi:hypothetical protein